MNDKIKKVVKVLLGIIVGIVLFMLTKDSETLPIEGAKFLGIFACVIVWLVTTALPDWVAGLIGMLAVIITKTLKFTAIFTGWSGTTVWIVLAALGFGYALNKCGLMGRLALAIIKRFPRTYGGQVLAMFVTGTVINPLIPSTNAKTLILDTYLQATCKELDLKAHSKPVIGMFSAIFCSTNSAGLALLTGSAAVPILLGYIDPEQAAMFSYAYWFKCAIIWWVVLLVLTYIAVLIMCRPAKGEKFEIPEGFIEARQKELGPMTSSEKKMLVVLAVCFTLWCTSKLHGIDATVVTLGSLVAAVLLGVIDSKEFERSIPWTFIIFTGAILGFASNISTVGVSAWLTPAVTSLMGGIIKSKVGLLIFTTIGVYVFRYIVNSNVAAMTVFYAVVAPFAAQMGVSGWVVIFTIGVASYCWPLAVTNTSEIAALVGTGGLVNHKDFAPMNYVYMVVSLLGVLASVPLWTAFGLM